MRARFCVLAAAAAGTALTLAGSALAGQKAVTSTLVFSGGGTAIDAFGGYGPCTVAVAGNGGFRVGGSGSFVVSRGGADPGKTSVCAGAAATLRFDVVGVSGTTDQVTLSVRVTQSDSASVPVGTTGTVKLQNEPNRIDVQIGPEAGGFGPDATTYAGYIATRADVKVAALQAATVTDYSGTGTAVDIYSGFGNCAVALAGTQTLTTGEATITTTVLNGGGAFASGGGQNIPTLSSCFGGPGAASLDVVSSTTDGEDVATVAVHARNGDPTTPDGSITISEPSQTVHVVLGAHDGTFAGPHTFFPNATAPFLDIRAGAEVETRLVGSTICKVTGGGWILSHDTFAATAQYRGGGDAPAGHLEYRDGNLKVQATTVTNVVCAGTHATLVGSGTANGTPVSYRVDLDDNGEPGRDDMFTIQLSNGYAASGTLSGGNIQIH